MHLYLDVETVPSSAAWVLPEVEQSVRPPGSIKKAETLAKWEAEERPAAIEEAYRRCALAPETAEIVAIAAVTEDGREWVRCRTPQESEADLLTDFFAWVELQRQERRKAWVGNLGFDWPEAGDEPVHLVAHNAAFDLSMLRAACVRCATRPPFKLPTALDRPGKGYTCTMQAFAGYGGKVSLRRLALSLGLLDPKADMDGEQVYDAWQAGRYADIARYCLGDALTVKAIFERMRDLEVA